MRVAWKDRFGKFPKRYNGIRWYCKYECLLEAYDNGWIDQLVLFLRSPDVHNVSGNVAVEKMLSWLSDDANSKWFHFMAELAVFLDLGTCLASTCYFLEGDGPLVLYAYRKLTTLEVNLRSQFATTGVRCHALLQRYPAEAAVLSARMQLALAPVHAYVVKRIMGDGQFVPAMNIMKGARYWDPSQLVALHRAGDQSQASVTSIMDEVAYIPFMNPKTHALLLSEFSSYYAAARDYVEADPPDPSPFFQRPANLNSFPTWCAEFQKVVLLQTSSGTVERCFSDFGNVHGPSQDSRMEETMCCAVRARYNARDKYVLQK